MNSTNWSCEMALMIWWTVAFIWQTSLPMTRYWKWDALIRTAALFICFSTGLIGDYINSANDGARPCMKVTWEARAPTTSQSMAIGMWAVGQNPAQPTMEMAAPGQESRN